MLEGRGGREEEEAVIKDRLQSFTNPTDKKNQDDDNV